VEETGKRVNVGETTSRKKGRGEKGKKLTRGGEQRKKTAMAIRKRGNY